MTKRKERKMPEKYWYKKGCEYRKLLMDQVKAERLEREAKREANKQASKMADVHALIKKISA